MKTLRGMFIPWSHLRSMQASSCWDGDLTIWELFSGTGAGTCCCCHLCAGDQQADGGSAGGVIAGVAASVTPGRCGVQRSDSCLISYPGSRRRYLFGKLFLRWLGSFVRR
jgi:hypothetical protein